MKKIGIVIPYYNNSEKAKELWIELEKEISRQFKEYNLIDKMEVWCLEDYYHEGLSITRNKAMKFFKDHDFEWILFLDSDDMINDTYLIDLYNTVVEKEKEGFNLIQTAFYIMDNLVEVKDELPNHVTGICYKTDLIKDLEFDPRLQYGEDKDFSSKVSKKDWKRYYEPKCKCIYNYGMNNECLTYKYSRGEISEYFERGDSM